MADDADLRMMKRDVVAEWRRGASNRPVQVLPAGGPAVFWCQGTFTERRHVAGRSLADVERVLGLRPGSLARGAVLYELPRLPELSEFELQVQSQPGAVPCWRMRPCTFVPVRQLVPVAAGRLVP